MRINWRLSRIDRYLLTEVTGPFFGGFAFFIFIFLMFQALRLAETFIVHGVSGWLLIKITFYLAMTFIPFALPVAFLIGVLVGFGRLSGDSELVAMKAGGMGLARLTTPLVGLALAVMSVALVLNFEWAPRAERTFKDLLVRVANTKAVGAIRGGTFTDFFNLLIFADQVDPKTNRMYKVFLYDEKSSPKNPMTYVAQEAEVIPVKPGDDGSSAAILRLKRGSSHQNNIQENHYQKYDFEEQEIYLKSPGGRHANLGSPRMMSLGELKGKLRDPAMDDYHRREIRGEIWKRIATAMSPLVMLLLGVGFGTVRTRSVRAGAALMGFLILITYWTIQTAATTALLKGYLPPFFAMQLPNLIALAVGIHAFRRAAW